MKIFVFRALILFCTLAVISGCSNPDNSESEGGRSTSTVADHVFFNGRVYTVDAENSWAEAIAVRDGKILAVGSNEQVLGVQGDGTVVIDLDGKMLMPGIHDSHMHPLEAGINAQFECQFMSNSLDEVLGVLKGCLKDMPAGQWLQGGQWNKGLFSEDMEPLEILDEIAPDNPVFLMDWSVHNAWVNSRALEVLGIDDNTEDPSGGKIVRSLKTGKATGILLDNAAYKYQKALPEYSLEQRLKALTWSIITMSEHGITTFKDAITTQESIEAYYELIRTDLMPLRVKTSLSWKSEWAKSHEAELELIENRAEFANEQLLDPEFIKIMLDGIPPTYTAALLEPYEPSEAFGSEHRGSLMHSPEQLAADVIKLDKQGLGVKIHATGDRSLRVALDAIEAAREANGDTGVIHEVSHAEMIHKDDLPRFAKLNAAAEMCPILWYPVPGLEWETFIGPERAKVWPIKSLVDSGALVFYGSDWPVVPMPNPWPGIEAMVTRSDPVSDEIKPDWPEQAVDLETAIRIFTINGAIVNKAGESSGSLETGKDADFIILNQNIFDTDIRNVSDTKVLMSMVAGNVIFRKQDFM